MTPNQRRALIRRMSASQKPLVRAQAERMPLVRL